MELKSLEQDGSQLADDVNTEKLLVEVVQGLLMAHARLDTMEEVLQKAVESASLRHLTAFDRKLQNVEVRFQGLMTYNQNYLVDLVTKVRVNQDHQTDTALSEHTKQAES